MTDVQSEKFGSCCFFKFGFISFISITVHSQVDLTTEQDRNSELEDKVKLLELLRADFLKEQEKYIKISKELEAMRQKIKRRDRHIEDLEDDNVKLQQLKQDLESNMNKKEFKIKKVEQKVSDLQHEVHDTPIFPDISRYFSHF